MNKTKTKREKRIVKLNTWKIVVIVILSLTVVIGISVGIYFAVSGTKFATQGNFETVSVTKAKNEINANGENNIASGVFFYSSDVTDQQSQYLMSNDNTTDSTNNVSDDQGPFAQYSYDSEMTWYGVDGNSKESKDSTQFTHDFFVNDENDISYNAEQPFRYIQTLSSTTDLTDVESLPQYILKVDDRSLDGGDYDYVVQSVDYLSGTATDFTLKTNMLFFFNANGDLTYVVDGVDPSAVASGDTGTDDPLYQEFLDIEYNVLNGIE